MTEVRMATGESVEVVKGCSRARSAPVEGEGLNEREMNPVQKRRTYPSLDSMMAWTAF